MLVECRPSVLVAARYDDLPFPSLQPIQEVAFDVGVTATDKPLQLRGMVVQGYHEHQLLFEQHWPGRVLWKRLGSEDLAIAQGTGLAVRGLHFMVPAYEVLTHVDVTVIARAEGRESDAQHSVQMPVRFHEQQTDLHFPLRGAWWAIQGSDWTDMHKQEVFSQAYATDFVRLGADNHFFAGDGRIVEQHYSWGQPVYATAGGKIAAVTYDLPDIQPGVPPDPRMFRGDPRRLLGNSIAISHGNGEFSYYGCLQQASARVNEGQVVRRGALLGYVGNSGMSPGPHLHFHLAEGPNPFIDQGLPVKFSHFSAGGQWFDRLMSIPSRMIVLAPEDGANEE